MNRRILDARLKKRLDVQSLEVGLSIDQLVTGLQEGPKVFEE